MLLSYCWLHTYWRHYCIYSTNCRLIIRSENWHKLFFAASFHCFILHPVSMDNHYKNCQSCGMPFDKDPSGGATNADGSKNEMYCGYCYKNGAFVQPDWTAEQMQEYVTNKMKQLGFPGFIASMFTKGIPELERWKNKK